jgi:hypothetical protein
LEDFAKRLGARLDLLVARNLSEVRSAMDTLSKDRPDAMYLSTTAAIYKGQVEFHWGLPMQDIARCGQRLRVLDDRPRTADLQ